MRVLLSVGFLFVVSFSAWAAPVPPCTSQSLADYIALTNGCQIGDKIFYDFAYGGGDGVTSASSVSVTPIDVTNDPGVEFGANWMVAAGVSSDAHIFFNVMVVPGGNLIEDDSLALAGVSNLNGNAGITVVEGVCLGVALNSADVCAGSSQNPVLQVNAPNTTSTFFDDLTFGGATYSVLGISKDIGLFGGTAPGSTGASVSIITQQFSEVPEPVAVFLFGTCLLAVAPILRRKLG